jgi:hypothetical protein
MAVNRTHCFAYAPVMLLPLLLLVPLLLLLLLLLVQS